MQVSKWGNSLAVRLPVAVVKSLDLAEGDDIEIRVAGAREFVVSRDGSRARAFAKLQQLRKPLPAGFRFHRSEANER